MTASKFIASLCGIVLAVAIVWAMGQKPIGESFSEMIRDPWGIVTLIDLYSGFVAFALVVALFEKPWVAALLFIALCVLGNVISTFWLVWRGFHLIRQQIRTAHTP